MRLSREIRSSFTDIDMGERSIDKLPCRVCRAVSGKRIHGQNFRRVCCGSRISESVRHDSIGPDFGKEVYPTHKKSMIRLIPCQCYPQRCVHRGVSQGQEEEIVIALRDLAKDGDVAGWVGCESYVPAYVIAPVAGTCIKESRIDMCRR